MEGPTMHQLYNQSHAHFQRLLSTGLRHIQSSPYRTHCPRVLLAARHSSRQQRPCSNHTGATRTDKIVLQVLSAVYSPPYQLHICMQSWFLGPVVWFSIYSWHTELHTVPLLSATWRPDLKHLHMLTHKGTTQQETTTATNPKDVRAMPTISCSQMSLKRSHWGCIAPLALSNSQYVLEKSCIFLQCWQKGTGLCGVYGLNSQAQFSVTVRLASGVILRSVMQMPAVWCCSKTLAITGMVCRLLRMSRDLLQNTAPRIIDARPSQPTHTITAARLVSAIAV